MNIEALAQFKMPAVADRCMGCPFRGACTPCRPKNTQVLTLSFQSPKLESSSLKLDNTPKKAFSGEIPFAPMYAEASRQSHLTETASCPKCGKSYDSKDKANSCSHSN